MVRIAYTEVVPQWSTHVGNNTVLEDDVVFLHRQEELAVARGLGKKPVAQVSKGLLPLRCLHKPAVCFAGSSMLLHSFAC